MDTCTEYNSTFRPRISVRLCRWRRASEAFTRSTRRGRPTARRCIFQSTLRRRRLLLLLRRLSRRLRLRRHRTSTRVRARTRGRRHWDVLPSRSVRRARSATSMYRTASDSFPATWYDFVHSSDPIDVKRRETNHQDTSRESPSALTDLRPPRFSCVPLCLVIDTST